MSFPVLGYDNFLSRDATGLTSDTLAVGSALANMTNPRITAYADLGTGPSVGFDVDFGSGVTLAPTLLFFRFRGSGWRDLVSVQYEHSANSDLSTPDLDATHAEQFPSAWTPRVPIRPAFRKRFTAPTARRYGRVTFARTAGDEPLRIAFGYLGASAQLTGTAGVRVYGSSVGVEDHSEEFLSGLQSDLHVRGSVRRTASIKVEAISEATVLDEWFPKLMYASAAEPVVYCDNPDETDDARIQWGSFVAMVGVGQRLEATVDSYNWWSQDVGLREVI